MPIQPIIIHSAISAETATKIYETRPSPPMTAGEIAAKTGIGQRTYTHIRTGFGE